jgi:hypothetical protein
MSRREVRVPESTTQGEGWPVWVQEWVLPYLDDSVLWPVLFALLAHVALILVPLMLQVWRHGSFGGVIGLGWLFACTAYVVRMEHRAVGRFRGVSLVLGLTWGLSLPLAWLCESTGVI